LATGFVMFHLYQHPDLDTLAALLAALRGRRAPASPLAPDTIIVPNRGTGRWLQAELAESEGCAANLDLPVPGRFVWTMLRDTLGAPDSADFERERLVWHLYALLPSVHVAEVQRYLAAAPRERHRYQLAEQLADLFDSYLVHRRDLIRAWEAGREAHYPPANWQAPVWRALIERRPVAHRAELMERFLARAERGELDPAGWPDPVYAFALPDLPADYVRLLYAMGRYVDVHFFLPNPSAIYWGDTPAKPVAPVQAGMAAREDIEANAPAHPLLASLGRAGRDFLRVLYADEFAAMQEPELGVDFAPQPPAGESLLQRVQAGVMTGEIEPEARQAPDDSLQIHACHGPLREVQVLHDRLLDLLSRWPDLQPRQIVVLLPDVARYAPAIQSVFDAADEGRRIPYALADRPRRDSHPIVQTFQQLIDLPLSRWTASEVLALAGIPAVMRRFGLDAGDRELLHHWIPAAGVRWGLDRETRAATAAADFDQNTWRFGLDRLLLGFAQRAENVLFDGVAPWSDLEGNSAAAVGRLWLLLDRLRAWRDALSEAADAATWQQRLNDMAGDLFAVDADDPGETAALETVHEAVAVLEGAAASLATDTLSWEAVREALLGALNGGAQRQPLVHGGVTFAGLEPLRGVPFEVVCMLGMDDGVFPRQDGQREFNLLQKHPRVGDPSVRDTERMTFLQSLMAARRCFYLSYTGRSVQDGEALQPSPVVGELLDYLHTWHFTDIDGDACRDAIVLEQPMHPFSPRYFDGETKGLFTFDNAWRAATRAQLGEREAPATLVDNTRLPQPDPTTPVDLGDLQRFYRHPAQWFFRERLHLELAEQAAILDDDEPRGLDGLEQHRLRERLFARAKAEGHGSLDTQPSALERARGRLPPAPLGASDHARAADDVNALLPVYWQWQAQAEAEAPVEIDLELADGTRVLGRVPGVGPEEMRRLRPGGLRLGHKLPWWLAYLAVVASGHEIGLRLAGTRDGNARQLAGQIDAETARAYLQAAVEHYRDGHTRPLLFEGYIAEHYLDELATISSTTGAPKTPDAALKDTNGRLRNKQKRWHPADDAWLQPLFELSSEPLGTTVEESTLVQIAETVASPIHQHLAEPGDAA